MGVTLSRSPWPRPSRRCPRMPRAPRAQARRIRMAVAAALLGRAAGVSLLMATGGRRLLLRCGTGAGLRERGTGTLLDGTIVCRAGGAAEQCLSRGISSDQRPKRPLTAYLRFVIDNRPAFREKNPGTRFEGRWARGWHCWTLGLRYLRPPQSRAMACAPQSGVSQEAETTHAFVKPNFGNDLKT